MSILGLSYSGSNFHGSLRMNGQNGHKSVLVIGGGIDGIQASLDLAGSRLTPRIITPLFGMRILLPGK